MAATGVAAAGRVQVARNTTWRGGTEVPFTSVCIVGSMRTFLQADVQASFVRLHRPGYEYFVSTDRPRPRAAELQVAPIRAWVAEGGGGELPRETGMPPCPKLTCNPHRFLLPMVRRYRGCYGAMQREEGARHIRYAFLLRVRPDHLFVTRPPAAAALVAELPPGGVALLDDQIAIARRDDAAAVLLAPSVAYAMCADRAEWEHACGEEGWANRPEGWSIGQCRSRNEAPCEPMTLITAFGGARAWRRAPLSFSAWQPRAEDGDLCIKRELYVRDNSESRCRSLAGCMDC